MGVSGLRVVQIHFTVCITEILYAYLQMNNFKKLKTVNELRKKKQQPLEAWKFKLDTQKKHKRRY
jgi:hypothetical protein